MAYFLQLLSVPAHTDSVCFLQCLVQQQFQQGLVYCLCHKVERDVVTLPDISPMKRDLVWHKQTLSSFCAILWDIAGSTALLQHTEPSVTVSIT